MWGVDVPRRHPVLRGLDHLDIWGDDATHTNILVEPEVMPLVQQLLEESQINYWVEVEDVMSLVQQERQFMKEVKKRTRRTRAEHPMDWDVYHDLKDIDEFLRWLKRVGGDMVQVVSVATTEEGRQVLVVMLTDPSSPLPKKKVWLEAGIHAREWISPAVATYILNLFATDKSWRDLLQVTEWYVVPVANPDGYQYTFTTDRARLWRKNRANNHSGCIGVDLNRNWNTHWGVGASANPCSETYKGLFPFSEPETQGLQAMMKATDIDLFISLHSYGQSVLYPYGWTKNSPANVNQLQHLATMFVNAVRATSHEQINYNMGGAAQLYGLASGATDDWAYEALNVSLSYTIELPDRGRYGFMLSEKHISSTAVETAEGLKCMVGYITGTEHQCANNRKVSWYSALYSLFW
nr:carboxypeptidase B-like [Procambarus clarkii]